jgi:hypothetical protein
MSPTPQNTRAQRNAAFGRSSGSTGHVVNIRYRQLANAFANVCFQGKADFAIDGRYVRQ